MPVGVGCSGGHIQNSVPNSVRKRFGTRKEGRKEGQMEQRRRGGWRSIQKQASVQVLVYIHTQSVRRLFRDNIDSINATTKNGRRSVLTNTTTVQHSPASSCAPRRSSQSRRSRGVFSPRLSHRPGFLASATGLPAGTSTRCRGSARSQPAAMTEVKWGRVVCRHNNTRQQNNSATLGDPFCDITSSGKFETCFRLLRTYSNEKTSEHALFV